MNEHFLMKPRPSVLPITLENARNFYSAIVIGSEGRADRYSDLGSIGGLTVTGVNFPRKLSDFVWSKSIGPVIWATVFIAAAAAMYVSHWNDLPTTSWFVFDLTTFTIACALLVALSICARKFTIKCSLNLAVHNEDREATKEQLQEMYGEYASRIYSYNGAIEVDVQISCRNAVRLDRHAKKIYDRSNLLGAVRRGDGGGRQFSGAANYNPADVSVVVIKGQFYYGFAAILLGLVAVVAMIFGPLALLIGLTMLLDYWAGYSWFGSSVLGLVLMVPVMLYTFLAVLAGTWGVVYSVALLIVGGFDIFSELFDRRAVRIRSLSGKWTTVLTTYSDIVAIEAFNLISRDIRRRDN